MKKKMFLSVLFLVGLAFQQNMHALSRDYIITLKNDTGKECVIKIEQQEGPSWTEARIENNNYVVKSGTKIKIIVGGTADNILKTSEPITIKGDTTITVNGDLTFDVEP